MQPPVSTYTTPINTWIVEDNTLLRQALISLVDESEDIVCTADYSSVEELEIVMASISAAKLPDVVIMDIKLPGKDGISGTRELKQKFPDVAVVMLTSCDEADTIHHALQAGAITYILKGTAHEQALLAIRHAAQGSSLMHGSVSQKVFQYNSTYDGNEKYLLSKRELDVLEQMCDGLIQKDIADRLFISENTVNQHIRSIYHKLEVNTRAGAVAKALRERILS